MDLVDCSGVPPTGFSDGSASFSTGIGGSLGDGFGDVPLVVFRRTVVWFLWLLQ
jgi:hypothetical protein